MNNNNHKILKLSSGEEIVAKLLDREHHKSFEIENPLKINTIPRITDEGMEESISLQRWIHFSSENVYLIDKNKVMIITDASIGLSKFYEYCVDKMNSNYDDIGEDPSDEQLDEIEADEMFEEYEFNSKLIH